jgi:arylesterase/paraoxonase
MFMDRAVTSVGYCHVDTGCKIAADHLPGANGITRSNSDADVFYLGSATRPEVRVLERQMDSSLVVTDVIRFGKFFVSTSLF